MRIGIDARFLTHPQPGGFKTYSESLIAALARVDTENDYVLYLDRAPDEQARIPRQPNFSCRVVRGEIPLLGMPFREQVGLAVQSRKDRLDLFHAPCLTAPVFLACPSVVTIHDTIWRFPDRFPDGSQKTMQRRLMRAYYRYLPELVSGRAAGVLTVSHSSGRDITRWLNVPAERVAITSLAADPRFRKLDDDQRVRSVCRNYGLPANFILALGSADPRKNVTTLLAAYALLPGEIQGKYPLVVVWAHAGVMQAAGRPGEQIRFISGVATEDLVSLYNAASLFVFPSRYEGFGLPLLEAMACGTPVVAANNSSFPEVAGDAAILVGCDDAAGLKDAMAQVLDDPACRQGLVENGLRRAASFSWDLCARQTIAAYQQAVRAGPRA